MTGGLGRAGGARGEGEHGDVVASGGAGHRTCSGQSTGQLFQVLHRQLRVAKQNHRTSRQGIAAAPMSIHRPTAPSHSANTGWALAMTSHNSLARSMGMVDTAIKPAFTTANQAQCKSQSSWCHESKHGCQAQAPSTWTQGNGRADSPRACACRYSVFRVAERNNTVHLPRAGPRPCPAVRSPDSRHCRPSGEPVGINELRPRSPGWQAIMHKPIALGAHAATLEDRLADDELLHFRSAFVNAQGANIAVQAIPACCPPSNACAAVHLQAPCQSPWQAFSVAVSLAMAAAWV